MMNENNLIDLAEKFVMKETDDNIKDVMNRDWDQSIWGLSGAITQVAQEYNAQRQYDFERFAGRLINSPHIAV